MEIDGLRQRNLYALYFILDQAGKEPPYKWLKILVNSDNFSENNAINEEIDALANDLQYLVDLCHRHISWLKDKHRDSISNSASMQFLLEKGMDASPITYVALFDGSENFIFRQKSEDYRKFSECYEAARKFEYRYELFLLHLSHGIL